MQKENTNFESYYEGENDVAKYLKPAMGKRFAIFTKSNTNNLIDLSSKPDNFVGLYDLNFLDDGNIMSNSEIEKKHNAKIIKEARGDVLIAGLGIGLILLPIMKKPEVRSIEVVELQQEIIDLIVPMLPLNKKVKIIKGNIIDFIPSHQYDCIYIDTLYTNMLLPNEIKDRMIDSVFIEDREVARAFRKQFLKTGGYCAAWGFPDKGKNFLHFLYSKCANLLGKYR